MIVNMSPTTGARPYRSELRTRQAAQTRLRVVEAAAERFSRQGYRATTYAQLAEQAGVSVKTVQEHGPKSALLQAAVELVSFGVEGETDFFATDVGVGMLAAANPDELALLVGRAMLAINEPSADLWMTVVSAAHGDSALTRFQHHMLGLVRQQVAHVLGFFDERGWLRQDVPFDDLVEAACVITCVETYVRFVQVDGRSTESYTSFVTRSMRETIFTP